EVGRIDPSHLGALDGSRRSRARAAEVEVEAHGAIGIDVRERAPKRPHLDVDPDLLQHLAPQALLDRLPAVALAPGELPPSSLMVSILAPRDQYPRSVPDDAGRHFMTAHRPFRADGAAPHRHHLPF